MPRRPPPPSMRWWPPSASAWKPAIHQNTPSAWSRPLPTVPGLGPHTADAPGVQELLAAASPTTHAASPQRCSETRRAPWHQNRHAQQAASVGREEWPSSGTPPWSTSSWRIQRPSTVRQSLWTLPPPPSERHPRRPSAAQPCQLRSEGGSHPQLSALPPSLIGRSSQLQRPESWQSTPGFSAPNPSRRPSTALGPSKRLKAVAPWSQ
mmetsp:Transcript_63291/g.138616  ORF Transcript_63291/g.138616 Transcript_63291/m.138616 type:complete len:208 (+) Transcript_63291:539-1162(+)